MLRRGGRELESRATALYSDAKQVGRWQALFTAEQINGWLATQLAENAGGELPKISRSSCRDCSRFTDARFRTSSGGVETVISVDAAVPHRTRLDRHSVDLRRAGALPLPVLQLAEELAAACKKLNAPVQWTRQDGKPVALVEIHAREPMYVDDIQLDNNQLYVAGHTGADRGKNAALDGRSKSRVNGECSVNLNDYELRLTPTNEHSALELAHRDSDRLGIIRLAESVHISSSAAARSRIMRPAMKSPSKAHLICSAVSLRNSYVPADTRITYPRPPLTSPS